MRRIAATCLALVSLAALPAAWACTATSDAPAADPSPDLETKVCETCAICDDASACPEGETCTATGCRPSACEADKLDGGACPAIDADGPACTEPTTCTSDICSVADEAADESSEARRLHCRRWVPKGERRATHSPLRM